MLSLARWREITERWIVMDWIMACMTVGMAIVIGLGLYFLITYVPPRCAETDTMIRVFDHWAHPPKGASFAVYTYECLPREGR